MDAVHEEMKHKESRLIGQQSVDVEKEPMEEVFQESPDQVADEEARQCLGERD